MSTPTTSIPTRPTVIIGHGRDCDDIAHALLLERDVDIVIYQEELIPTFQARSIPCRSIWSFLTPDQRSQSVMEGTLRATELRSAVAELDELADGLGGISAATIAERLYERARYDFANETIMIDALRACASQTDLRLVIVPQDVARDMKTLTIAARRLGLPVLHQLHGYPCGSLNMTEDVHASHLAAYSDADAAIYRDFGAQDVEVTGNPYWDEFLRPPDPALRARILDASHLDGDKPILLIVLSYSFRLSTVGLSNPGWASATLNAVLAGIAPICADHPDLQVVVRPHPNWVDAIDDIDGRLKKLGITRSWIDCELSTPAAIAIADLAICTESNFGIEALMQGVPSVNVNIPAITGGIFSEGLGSLFQEGDAICTVRDENNIEPTVRALLFDDAAREALMAKRAATLRRFSDTVLPDSLTRFARHALSVMDAGLPAEEPMRHEHIEPILASLIPENVGTTGNSRDDRGPVDCLIVPEPIATLEQLRAVIDHVKPGGSLIFFVHHAEQHGAQEVLATGGWALERPSYERADILQGFSRNGLEIMLSRLGLQAVAWVPQRDFTPKPVSNDLSDPSITGWAVRAQRKDSC